MLALLALLVFIVEVAVEAEGRACDPPESVEGVEVEVEVAAVEAEGPAAPPQAVAATKRKPVTTMPR